MTETNEWPAAASLEWDRKVTDAKFNPLATSRRNEPRVMVRFKCQSRGVHIPGGTQAKLGVNTMLIYKSEVPALRAMQPTAEEISDMERAKRDYAGHLAGIVVEMGVRETSGPDYERAMREAEATAGVNPYGLFHRIRNPGKGQASPNRDWPPISDLEVGPEVAPPETEQSVKDVHAAQARAQLSDLGREMKEAFAAAIRESAAATAAAVAGAIGNKSAKG